METPGIPEATEPERPTPTSLGARLVNIFAAPGEVFEEIKAAKPDTRNWLVPVLLSCVAAVVSIVVIFSQPTVQQQMRDQQEKRFQKLVDAGQLPAAQKDRLMEQMERYGPIGATIAGSISAVAMTFGMLFLVALAIWLIGGKLFKGPFVYMKAVEVVGLSGMIAALDAVVTALLVASTGNMYAKPGPSLLIHDADMSQLPQMLLISVDVMQLWYVGVMAVGLAKLSGAKLATAAAWLYAIYLILLFGLVLFGWSAGRAMGGM